MGEEGQKMRSGRTGHRGTVRERKGCVCFRVCAPAEEAVICFQ